MFNLDGYKNMPTNISLIIPTMNRPQSLDRTLGFISKSSILPSQIIIIDQSTNIELREDTQSVIHGFSNHLNLLYEFQDVPSLTKARNRGLELATEEIIVFMDDDVDVRENTFATVIDLMIDSRIALVGGYNEGEEYMNNSTLGYLFLRSSYRKRYKGHVSLGVYGRFPMSKELNVDTEWTMGFFFVIRKSLVRKWNMRFDENLKYYAYAEDLDFTYGYYLNASKENYRCIMSRVLTVRHNTTPEFRTTQYKVTMMEMIHREYIANKYNFCRLGLYWCNIGTFIFRVIKRNNPLDVLHSMRFISKNRAQITRGEFLYEEYMK